jgi:hypothetical protein
MSNITEEGPIIIVHGIGSSSICVYIPSVIAVNRYRNTFVFHFTNGKFLEISVCTVDREEEAKELFEALSDSISDWHIRRYRDSQ